MEKYNVHNVIWTDEKVKRFWDFYNNNKAFDNLWFSKLMGMQILNLVRKYAKIQGNVLDYGMGKGHLTNFLLQDNSVEVYGCDFSEETVYNSNKRFNHINAFKGCSLVREFPSEYPSDKFDFVFLIEAIEHLTDDYLNNTISEVKRVLKPNGVFVITTPNDEELDLQNVACPDCGCVFHRVQHVRSFNKTNLESLMKKCMLTTIYCDATDFQEYGNKKLLHILKNKARSVLSTLKYPHLIYIGKKVI